MTPEVVGLIRQRAISGITTGRDRKPDERAYLSRCTHFHWHTGTVVMFTSDTGHHSSGWMKNPDYERCWHLSLSFRQPFPERTGEALASVTHLGRLMRSLGQHIPNLPFDYRLGRAWVDAIYGETKRFAWEEGPFSSQGKELDVRHFRIFCDPRWVPILPRGEVYSRDFTEKGWRSWSEVQGEDAPPNWVDAT